MYNFTNLSDEKLAELAYAVHEERKRRFIDNESSKYPRLAWVDSNNNVLGIKTYREKYGLSLSEARILFHMHHRSGC